MKSLWKCSPETNESGEPIHTLIMEHDDVEILKQEGAAIAQANSSPNSRWVWGPNTRKQYQMELGDGSILTIREGDK